MNGQNRIDVLDGLRGFSLLGILLANLLIFQYGFWGKDYIDYFELSLIDKWVYSLIKIAVEGSFMPIFAFLFGYSLMMMRNKLKADQLRVKWYLFRRFFVLGVLGILHSIFLWEGDILFLYGMMGVFLLLFVNRKAKTLLIWTVSLLLLLGAGDVFNIFDNKGTDDFYNSDAVEPYVQQTTEVYSEGSYAEIKEYRNHAEDPMEKELTGKKAGFIMLLLPFVLAPLFLFGMYTAKRQWFINPTEEKRFYATGFGICLPIGITLKFIGHFMDVQFILGDILLALGYIFLLSHFYSSAKFKCLLQLLQNIGKLSLTNYLMQTIICTTIFYGYGFGMFGKLGVFWATLIGLIIFGLQIIFSTYYLKHFHYGPFEKVVRICTNLTLSGKRNNRVTKVIKDSTEESVV